MRLQNLTDVHSGWYTEWIQNYVNRSSVCKIWHILHRQDLGYYALVSVPTGHLITY